MQIRSLIWFIVGCIVGALLAYNSSYLKGLRGDVERDTIVVTKTDTIRDTLPIPIKEEIMRYKTIKVRVDSLITDTIVRCDTAFVTLPISQKVYQDSTYKAYVSGYDAKLDSINVYQRQSIVTVIERTKPKHWHLGISTGVGANHKGFTPYVGLGITYSIWSF